MNKIDQIKQYIKKGIKHYRDQKESVGVEALQNTLTYIESLEVKPKTPTAPTTSVPSRFECVIATRFTEYSKSFYEGLVTGPVTIYIEKEKKVGRGTKIVLEPVGRGQAGITGNLIYIQGQMVESQGNTMVLTEDSVGGPALKVVTSEQPNIKYII